MSPTDGSLRSTDGALGSSDGSSQSSDGDMCNGRRPTSDRERSLQSSALLSDSKNELGWTAWLQGPSLVCWCGNYIPAPKTTFRTNFRTAFPHRQPCSALPREVHSSADERPVCAQQSSGGSSWRSLAFGQRRNTATDGCGGSSRLLATSSTFGAPP